MMPWHVEPTALLTAAVALPFLGALFVLLMPGSDRLALRSVGMATLVIAGLLALPSCVTAWNSNLSATVVGVKIALTRESALALLFLLTGGPVALRAGAPRIQDRSQFYVVTLLFAQGMLVIALLAEALFLRTALAALAAVPMFALVALFGGPQRGTTTYRAALLWLGVDIIALTALAWLCMRAGVALDGASPAQLAATVRPLPPSTQAWIAIAVAGPGLLRLAAGPYAVWLQPFAEQAPLSALLVAVLGAMPVGAALLVSAGPVVAAGMSTFAGPALVVCAVSAILAGVTTLAQRDLRDLWAQLLMLAGATAGIAILVDDPAARWVGLWHAVMSGATAGAWCIAVEAIERRTESRDVHALTGLSHTAPLLAGLCLFGAVGLVGAPAIGAGPSAWHVMRAVLAAPTLHDGSLRVLVTVLCVACAHALAAIGVLLHMRRLFAPPTARARRDVLHVTPAQALRVLVPFVLVVALSTVLVFSSVLTLAQKARQPAPRSASGAASGAAP